MTDHLPDHLTDQSTSRLLREATTDLVPDVEHLVRGGVVRGRTARRRRRVGTSLAAGAMVGVIGLAVSVGPALIDGSDPRPRVGVAAEPTPTPTAAPTANLPTVADPQPAVPDRPIVVPAEDIPLVVIDTLGGGDGGGSGAPLGGDLAPLDDPEHKIVHFLYEGTLATFVIERADSLASCAALVAPENQPDGEPGGVCEVVDGIEMLRWRETADQVTAQGVMVWLHGYVVSVLSYNAAEGKDVAPLTAEPPISMADLTALATDDLWFGAPAGR